GDVAGEAGGGSAERPGRGAGDRSGADPRTARAGGRGRSAAARAATARQGGRRAARSRVASARRTGVLGDRVTGAGALANPPRVAIPPCASLREAGPGVAP